MTLAQMIERTPSDRTVSGQGSVTQPRANAPIDLRQLVRRPPVGEPPRGQVVTLAPTPIIETTAPVAAVRTMAAPAVAAPLAVKPVATPVAPAAPDLPRPKSDVAFGLLDKLATAVPTLVERNKTLEAELAVTRAQASADLADAQGRAKSLLEMTERLKAQVAHFERDMAALTQRAHAAEEEVKGFRATTEEAQRAAAHAECLSSLFEDKLIAAFGTGSIGHAILESTRARN